MSDLHSVYVPANGPDDAKIMLVGEGPGRDEVREGRGFVGRAGKELDKWLAASGIVRDDCYITNVTHYLPKGDKDKFFIDKGQLTPVYLEGIKELISDIKRIKPNVVVPLGNYALLPLFGQMGITKYAGSILESKTIKGQKLIPVEHPASILRQMNRRAICVWHMQKVARESARPEIVLPKRDLRIRPDQEEILSAVERLLRAEFFVFDVEAPGPDRIWGISFSDSPDWAIWIDDSTPGSHEIYKRLLESDVPKINQNIMFDVTQLWRSHRIDVRNVVGDTMIAQHCSWTDIVANSLAELCSIYTDEPYYKDDADFTGETFQDEKSLLYACKDSAVTCEVAIKQRDDLEFTGTKTGYETTMSIFPIMAAATNFGIRVDRALFKKKAEEHLAKADSIEATLSEVFGGPFNAKSPPQTKELIFDIMKIGGGRKKSTARQILLDLAAQESNPEKKAIITAVIRARENRDVVSKYLQEDLIDVDGRVRCHWKLNGTKNGRLSSQKIWKGTPHERGVNLQTIPDDIREIYIPDDGYVFVVPDFEQAEARVVAHLCEDEDLIEAFEEGRDIHTELACMLYDDVPENCGKGTKRRYIAKKTRHGKNYMMGPLTLKLSINDEYLETGFGVTAEEAKILDSKYMSLYPNLQLWWKAVSVELSRNGALINLLGRRRRFLGFWGDTMLRDAIAFVPQSTIADLTTQSIVRLSKAAPYIRTLVHTHDGALMQVPEKLLDDAIPEIEKAFSVPLKIKNELVKIPVEIKKGYSWKDLEATA